MIAITNHSTRIDEYSCRLIAWACQWQLRRDIAPGWGRVPIAVEFFKAGRAVPAFAWEIAIFDDSDQAGALGYHSLTPKGLPYGRVFVAPVLDNGGTIQEGENSCSAVMSHEVAEAFIDPSINLWSDGPNNQDYAIEIGDPVEADSYDIVSGAISVAVSNFVLPAWFSQSPLAGSRFDFMSKVAAPFTLTTGGYQVVRSNGPSSQIQARITGLITSQTLGHPSARHSPDHPASRTWKRMNRTSTFHPHVLPAAGAGCSASAPVK